MVRGRTSEWKEDAKEKEKVSRRWRVWWAGRGGVREKGERRERERERG